MIDIEIENRLLHGFYVDLQEKTMRFDVIMSFEIILSTAVSCFLESHRCQSARWDLIHV